MVTQQEKEMLWECFGEGSGVEIHTHKRTETIQAVHGGSSVQCVADSGLTVIPDCRVNVRPTLAKITGE